jgi:hypothetical protein
MHHEGYGLPRHAGILRPRPTQAQGFICRTFSAEQISRFCEELLLRLLRLELSALKGLCVASPYMGVLT